MRTAGKALCRVARKIGEKKTNKRVARRGKERTVHRLLLRDNTTTTDITTFTSDNFLVCGCSSKMSIKAT